MARWVRSSYVSPMFLLNIIVRLRFLFLQEILRLATGHEERKARKKEREVEREQIVKERKKQEIKASLSLIGDYFGLGWLSG